MPRLLLLREEVGVASVRDFDRFFEHLYDPERGASCDHVCACDGALDLLRADLEEAHRRIDVLVDIEAERVVDRQAVRA